MGIPVKLITGSGQSGHRPERDGRQHQHGAAQEPETVTGARRGEGGHGPVKQSAERARAQSLVNDGKWMAGHQHRAPGDTGRDRGKAACRA